MVIIYVTHLYETPVLALGTKLVIDVEVVADI